MRAHAKKRLEIATEMDVKAQQEMPCFLRPDQFRGVSHLVLGKTIPCSPRRGQDVTLLHIVTWPSLDTLKAFNWLGQNTVFSCTFWLVVSTPLKNKSSSVGIIIPTIWKNKKCLKPPTSIEVLKYSEI